MYQYGYHEVVCSRGPAQILANPPKPLTSLRAHLDDRLVSPSAKPKARSTYIVLCAFSSFITLWVTSSSLTGADGVGFGSDSGAGGEFASGPTWDSASVVKFSSTVVSTFATTSSRSWASFGESASY